MTLKDVKLPVTTDTDGAGSVEFGPITGYLEAVEWVKGDWADGVDGTFKVTKRPTAVDVTFLTLTNANANATYYPRVIINGSDGGTIAGVYERYLLDGHLSLTVAEGGSTSSGHARVVYRID